MWVEFYNEVEKMSNLIAGMELDIIPNEGDVVRIRDYGLPAVEHRVKSTPIHVISDRPEKRKIVIILR